jgi:CRP/FNR family cyclic AMP-dependent transcriptional regulator
MGYLEIASDGETITTAYDEFKLFRRGCLHLTTNCRNIKVNRFKRIGMPLNFANGRKAFDPMAKWRWPKQIIDDKQLQRLRFLGSVPLFAGLSQKQLGKLLVKLFEKEYSVGETVFLQGDPGKALFIVLSGKILIMRSRNAAEEQVAALDRGSYFGELALIDDQPRSASARAGEPSVLLILYKSDFDDLIEGHRAIAIKVMANLLKALAGYVRVAQSRGGLRNVALTDD